MSTSRPTTPTPFGQQTSALQSGHFLKAKTKPEESKANIIIPNGLLVNNLDYRLSMAEFNKLASSPINWQAPNLMGNILKADQLLKMGGSKEEFRKTISQLLQLKKEVTEKEFDAAWNAMLGNLNKLKSNYLALKQQNVGKQIILMSGTSSIHTEATFQALAPEEKPVMVKTENPLKIEGLDLYVSYLQKPLSTEEYKAEIDILKDITTDENILKELIENITLLNQIISDQKISANTAVIVLELSSHLSDKALAEVQNKNDRVALAKKLHAEKKGLLVAPFDRNKITEQIDAVAVITKAVDQELAKLKEESNNTVRPS